ncbi:MAG: metallophosphoesterase [Aigarchaeota archaeon]|nr:metallophosphoesterase [Aigarchaeota archaeon]MCX8193098.1 metallophosphoesterase [Nitrososphaeria archaeon]
MRFLDRWPAILIEKPEPTIIVSDIHYGFEVELNERGIRVPVQTQKITDSLIELVREHGVYKVIVLGDFKHKVPLSSWIEWREMPKALRSLRENGVEISLVLGNHDGGIKKILGSLIRYFPSSGILLKGEKKFFMFHGHRWPSTSILEADVVFMGHLHPMINLRTDVGNIVKKPIWLILEGDKNRLAKIYKEKKYDVNIRSKGKMSLIVFPAFNPMLTGISVNNLNPRDRLWPLIKSKSFFLDEAEVVLLDGQNLGRLKEIERMVEE